MSEGSGKAREIDLGHDFGDVVVKANGTQVKISADGSIQAYTNSPFQAYPAANDDEKPEPSTVPEIGGQMPDGTVYAGISPDTGEPMYTTPTDAPLTDAFYQAQIYAEKLDANGHKDWRVPTEGELNMLWENRNKGKLEGTFTETASNYADWYRSSSPYNSDRTWGQRFSDGHQVAYVTDLSSSLRCVR